MPARRPPVPRASPLFSTRRLPGRLRSVLRAAVPASAALLAAYALRTSPYGLLGLLVGLALLGTCTRRSARSSGEARLFAELARSAQQLAGCAPDVCADAVLRTAARLFDAEAEMVRVAPEGPVRHLAGPGGATSRSRVGPQAFDAPEVLRALGARSVSSGTEQGRPWCSAVLGAPDARLAVLVVRRPDGAGAFGRADVRLVQVLAAQAEAWLSAAGDGPTRPHAADGVAARALDDLGAQSRPARPVLRDSAHRLSQLADGAAEVQDIVEELHLVERAVAGLLGAVALADGRATPRPDALPAPRRPTDWATTGVLR